MRERLLCGYRRILVDEYQDIDARQYALISALAGRTAADPDSRLTILAVGDDDQNIYAWRHTSNEFIRRFEADYAAKVEYLVENYRSSRNIIACANALIAPLAQRLKRDHAIRINHARCNDPAGGRWEALDPIGRGRVQILTVPRDAIGQAAAVMRELQRLHALDPTADWSDFALLARNHATLEPLRGACELAGIPYSTQDREHSGQPRLHQVREGRALLDLLDAKPQRRLRAGTIARWAQRRFPDPEQMNPWAQLLGQLGEEVEAAWSDLRLPVSLAKEALFEFGNEARRSVRGRLVLSTVHAAKGREFKHVVMLDGGDWRDSGEEERRLYYVGMTRAKETVSLCQSQTNANPFSCSLADASQVMRSPLPRELDPQRELRWRYAALGLSDVDLGFAGRQPAGSASHVALGALASGDALVLESLRPGARVFARDGTAVGRLSRGCRLPAGRIVRASVCGLVWRSRTLTPVEYRDSLRCDGWWVVLPTVVIQPDEAGAEREAMSTRSAAGRAS